MTKDMKESRQEFAAALGRNISKARKHKGLDELELGKKCGLSRQHIAGYEAGITIPGADKLHAIASHLHVSVDELLPPPLR